MYGLYEDWFAASSALNSEVVQVAECEHVGRTLSHDGQTKHVGSASATFQNLCPDQLFVKSARLFRIDGVHLLQLTSVEIATPHHDGKLRRFLCNWRLNIETKNQKYLSWKSTHVHQTRGCVLGCSERNRCKETNDCCKTFTMPERSEA